MSHWAGALGPLVTHRSRRRATAVVAIALLLLIGILVRFQNSDEGNGLLALQVIPIALVALELGRCPDCCYRFKVPSGQTQAFVLRVRTTDRAGNIGTGSTTTFSISN